jgi:uncharacterized LabA/DUF88 family protein
MDRAGVFIDAGYFSKLLKDHGRPRIDFQAFSEILCEKVKAERFRTYYYDCMPFQSNPPTMEERERYASMDKFIHNLKRLDRFEVRLGRLQYIDGSFKQKGVDVLLSIDVTKLSWRENIQKAILITGDSDFVPAVKEAKEAGVIVSVCYGSTNSTFIHDELFNLCDNRILLDKKLLDACKRQEAP